MTIIDIIWFRPNEFLNIAFENTNAIGFSDFRVQIVPLICSRKEKREFKKVMFCPKFGNIFWISRKYLVFGERTNWKR